MPFTSVRSRQDREGYLMSGVLMFSGENLPFAGDALEWTTAAAAEAQAGTGHQILHGARYQNLARAGQRGDARTDVNGDAADIVADHFALAGMQPGADLDADRPDFVGDRAGTANAARWTVKRCEKAVARSLHLMAAKSRQIAADGGVMMVEQIAPALVAEVRGLFSGADDVGEKHGGENAVDRHMRPRVREKFLDRVGNFLSIRPGVIEMVGARKLEQPRAGNLRRHVAPALYTDRLFAGAVNHQRR